MPTDNAEHITDISTEEDNANNEILADSDSLQIQAITNSIVPKILQGVNERLHNLVTNILSQKGFLSTEGYDDEFDEEKSDRDASAQNNQIVRDAGAQQTGNRDAAQQIIKNMAVDAQNFGKKKYVNTPQIIRNHANNSDSTNNKSFNNVDELLQYTSNTTRKCTHSAASSTPQRDRTPPLQMSLEIFHQLEDEMGMHVDEFKNINQGLSTQLMHSFLNA